MLAKRIIPCLDVANGRVVKGVQFLGLRDAGDPVEIARRYDAEGADEIVFLDSEGVGVAADAPVEGQVIVGNFDGVAVVGPDLSVVRFFFDDHSRPALTST